jgi:hypothetical protein
MTKRRNALWYSGLLRFARNDECAAKPQRSKIIYGASKVTPLRHKFTAALKPQRSEQDKESADFSKGAYCP